MQKTQYSSFSASGQFNIQPPSTSHSASLKNQLHKLEDLTIEVDRLVQAHRQELELLKQEKLKYEKRLTDNTDVLYSTMMNEIQ